MHRLFQPFFALLATTAADRELVGMVRYFKVENQVLRGKPPKRVAVTSQKERRQPLPSCLRSPGWYWRDMMRSSVQGSSGLRGGSGREVGRAAGPDPERLR
jgi:hypothetical protein